MLQNRPCTNVPIYNSMLNPFIIVVLTVQMTYQMYTLTKKKIMLKCLIKTRIYVYRCMQLLKNWNDQH